LDWSTRSQLTGLLTVLLSTAAPLAAVHAAEYGRVGAVNPNATGTPPGGSARTLKVGSDVVIKERIRTSDQGSTQIQFPDQSTLNIGGNSDLVIDQFIYDPQARSGTMVASAAKGVLRYVGGNISHGGGTTINTPSGTLGIRGGIVTIMLPLPRSLARLDPALANLQGELVISHFGTISLRNNVSQLVVPSGFATVITSPNTPIPPPFRLSAATLKAIMAWINSKSGQNGGVANGPNPTQLPPGFGFTNLRDPTNAPGTDPLGYTSIFSAGSGAAKSKAETKQLQNVPPPPSKPAVNPSPNPNPNPGCPPSYPNC